MQVKSFAYSFNDYENLVGHVLDVRGINNPMRVHKGMVVSDGDLRSEAMNDPLANELIKEGIEYLKENPEGVLLVGCDYGRHRSVAVANAVAGHFGIRAEHLSPGSNGKNRSVVIE